VDAVEDDARADLLVLRRRVEREHAAHAEADRAHGRGTHGRVREQELDRAAQVPLGALDVEGHHQLARLVGRARGLAVVKVWRERDEALGGQPVGHVPDVRHEPPPLLYDDDARPRPRLGHGQVALGLAAVARKLHRLVRHNTDSPLVSILGFRRTHDTTVSRGPGPPRPLDLRPARTE
jgi:hypothetical protein